MQFIKNIKFTFLGFVLSILLPLITMIILFMAIFNYNSSHDTILDGFNKKLLAIATVSSSFIEGEKHETIAIAKEMSSFTYDEKSHTLYAFSIEPMLYRINTLKGAAIAIEGFNKKQLSTYRIYDMTNHSNQKLLYAVTYNKEVLSLNLETKQITIIKKLNFLAEGIAYFKNKLYLSSNTSLYELKNNKVHFLQKYAYPIKSLSVSNEILYGINSKNNTLFSIDTKTLLLKDNIAEKFPLENGKIYHLAVSKDYFYTGRNHLILYERNSSNSIQDDFSRLYRDETSILYQHYIEPMTEIKMALNLSYHYTFNLLYGDSENNCFYIMDVNEGNEYTPIGSYDNMSTKDLTGAENVILRNETYVSDIKLWKKWGLLKVAYAGIKNKSNEVVAVTGADIDVSIISKKTKEALILSILIGILALIIGILASYFIAMKIIRPIETLKTSALKIAAGNYGDNVLIQSPKELQELSIEFNQMSSELASTVNNNEYETLETSNENHNAKRKLSELFIKNDTDLQITGLRESHHLVGLVEYENTVYIYAIDEVCHSLLEVYKKRVIINTLLEKAILSNTLLDLSHAFKFTNLFSIDKENLKIINNLYQNFLIPIKENEQSKTIVIKDIKILITKKEKLS
ncbi:MAG: Unknown protein [uncultured Sulfurovum sp.]|uniref:HAMP domain-containing protein n=1 Tax=uncultured Sulfurovum sp. TaxID=269237 RepID=A0A6S6SG38_9BACT|nr:MAG: Unknown protein [uncultured Sulfurovum sp.]